MPSADVCYFADCKWWRWHKDKPEFIEFAGEKCSIENTGMTIEDPAVHILRNDGADGVSHNPQSLKTGRNSGYQAINLAILAGAKTIILLGYDAKEPEFGKPSHWFGFHPDREPMSVFALYRKAFKDGAGAIKAAGVRVINSSPGSAIDVFERMPLEEALLQV